MPKNTPTDVIFGSLNNLKSSLLYILDQKDALQPLKYALAQQCHQRQWLAELVTLINFSQLDEWLEDAIIGKNGQLQTTPGPLGRILFPEDKETQDRLRVVIVDFANTPPKVAVRYNALFDAEPRFQGRPLQKPENFRIIGVIDTENLCNFSSDFYSRFSERMTVSKISSLEIPPAPSQMLEKPQEENKFTKSTLKIPLGYNPNWREQLLGGLDFDSENDRFKNIDGQLLKALSQVKNTSATIPLVFEQCPPITPDFADFIDQLCATGKIYTGGKERTLGKLLISQGQAVPSIPSKIKCQWYAGGKPLVNAYPINTHNFESCFRQITASKEGKVIFLPGLIPTWQDWSTTQKVKSLHITSAVSEEQWLRLLEADTISSGEITLTVDSDIHLPNWLNLPINGNKPTFQYPNKPTLETSKHQPSHGDLYTTNDISAAITLLQKQLKLPKEAIFYVTQETGAGDLLGNFKALTPKEESKTQDIAPSRLSYQQSTILKEFLLKKQTVLLVAPSLSPSLLAEIEALLDSSLFYENGAWRRINGRVLLLERNDVQHPVLAKRPRQYDITIDYQTLDKIAHDTDEKEDDDNSLLTQTQQIVDYLRARVETLPPPTNTGYYPTSLPWSWGQWQTVKQLATDKAFSLYQAIAAVLLGHFQDAPEVHAYLMACLRLHRAAQSKALDNKKTPFQYCPKLLNCEDIIEFTGQIWQLTEALDDRLLACCFPTGAPGFTTAEKLRDYLHQLTIAAAEENEKQSQSIWTGKIVANIYKLYGIEIPSNEQQWQANNHSAPPPWSLRPWAELSQRDAYCTKILARSVALFLMGPPGAGKSYSALRLKEPLTKLWDKKPSDSTVVGPLTLRPDARISDISAELIRWATATTACPILLLDEANLLDDAQLNPLRGLFQSQPGLWISGKYYPLDPKRHRLLMTGNRLSAPGRQWGPFMQDHMTVIYFAAMSPEVICAKLLSDNFFGAAGISDKKEQEPLRAWLRTAIEGQQRLTPETPLTLRGIGEILRYYAMLGEKKLHINGRPLSKSLKQKNLDQPLARFCRAWWEAILQNLTPAQRKAIKIWFEWRHGWQDTPAEIGSNLKDAYAKKGISLTASSSEYLTSLLLAFASRQWRVDSASSNKKQNLFVGRQAWVAMAEAGRGKDIMIKLLLEYFGFADLLGNKPPKDATKGYYYLNAGNWSRFSALTQKAAKEGSILIIPELNAFPSAALESVLNDRLTGSAHPAFALFSTANRDEYAGREPPSAALQSRLTYWKLPSYRKEELTVILKQRLTKSKSSSQNSNTTNAIHKAVDYHVSLSETLATHKPNLPRPTARDISHLMAQFQSDEEKDDKLWESRIINHYTPYSNAISRSLWRPQSVFQEEKKDDKDDAPAPQTQKVVEEYFPALASLLSGKQISKVVLTSTPLETNNNSTQSQCLTFYAGENRDTALPRLALASIKLAYLPTLPEKCDIPIINHLRQQVLSRALLLREYPKSTETLAAALSQQLPPQRTPPDLTDWYIRFLAQQLGQFSKDSPLEWSKNESDMQKELSRLEAKFIRTQTDKNTTISKRIGYLLALDTYLKLQILKSPKTVTTTKDKKSTSNKKPKEEKNFLNKMVSLFSFRTKDPNPATILAKIIAKSSNNKNQETYNDEKIYIPFEFRSSDLYGRDPKKERASYDATAPTSDKLRPNLCIRFITGNISSGLKKASWVPFGYKLAKENRFKEKTQEGTYDKELIVIPIETSPSEEQQKKWQRQWQTSHIAPPAIIVQEINDIKRSANKENIERLCEAFRRGLTYSKSKKTEEFWQNYHSTTPTTPICNKLFDYGSGICRQTASAFAQVLHQVAPKLPVRQVSGYCSYGEYIFATPHRWVEVALPDNQNKLHWVIFDPTPVTSDQAAQEFYQARDELANQLATDDYSNSKIYWHSQELIHPFNGKNGLKDSNVWYTGYQANPATEQKMLTYIQTAYPEWLKKEEKIGDITYSYTGDGKYNIKRYLQGKPFRQMHSSSWTLKPKTLIVQNHPSQIFKAFNAVKNNFYPPYLNNDFEEMTSYHDFLSFLLKKGFKIAYADDKTLEILPTANTIFRHQRLIKRYQKKYQQGKVVLNDDNYIDVKETEMEKANHKWIKIQPEYNKIKPRSHVDYRYQKKDLINGYYRLSLNSNPSTPLTLSSYCVGLTLNLEVAHLPQDTLNIDSNSLSNLQFLNVENPNETDTPASYSWIKEGKLPSLKGLTIYIHQSPFPVLPDSLTELKIIITDKDITSIKLKDTILKDSFKLCNRLRSVTIQDETEESKESEEKIKQILDYLPETLDSLHIYRAKKIQKQFSYEEYFGKFPNLRSLKLEAYYGEKSPTKNFSQIKSTSHEMKLIDNYLDRKEEDEITPVICNVWVINKI